MPTGKRARALITAGLVAAGTTAFAGGAQAQSNEQMLRMIQDLSAKVEELTEQVQTAAIKADSAETRAAAAQKTATGDVKFKWGPSPTIQSADGKFEMHVRGRLLVDFGHVSDGADKQKRNGTEFRALRLGIEGKAWKDFKYKMEIDFAENTVDITDAYLEYAGWDPFYVLVGHAKTTNSMEELTSSRHIDLVERGGFTDAFNFNRRIGIQAGYVGDWFRVDVGGFGSELDEPDVDFNDEGYALSARAVAFPKIGNDGILHIGASVLYRNYNDDFADRTVRYRQRPHAHISGIRYVDTNNLNAGSDLFFGVELAGIMGPFWANAEWGWLKVKDIVGQPGDSATFQGGYFGVGWFITGEQRGYDEGTFDRPKKVNKPVFEGGWGAIALVGRIDFVDLNDTFGGGPCIMAASGICGGEQLTYVVGVNWFLNRHTVIKLNYAHSDVDKAFDNLGDTFPNGKNSIDSFTARFQVDW